MSSAIIRIAASASILLALSCSSTGSPSGSIACNSNGDYVSPPGSASVPFECMAPGALLPGRGTGAAEDNVVVANLRFPIKNAPAYANSQFWRYKGGYNTAWPDQAGDALGTTSNDFEQCDDRNYSYPWQDTFCEERTAGVGGDHDTVSCPNEEGHQGIDIRGPFCETDDSRNAIVAVADGTVTVIQPHYQKQWLDGGQYYVNYMHMLSTTFDQSDLNSGGIDVDRGDRLGNIGNVGGNDTYTTRHLHFEIRTNYYTSDGSSEIAPVSPYATMVESYRRLLDGTP